MPVEIRTPEEFNAAIGEKQLTSDFAGVKFLKVSAEELEDFCEEIDVDSFPTFRVYKDGEVASSYVSSKFEKVEQFIRENAQ
ncbi:hypothetical protein Pcac1_g587 [Phytophthora cactorum]|nr:hypothetical protein Pcac1_g587 [Phytophthora cactorum]